MSEPTQPAPTGGNRIHCTGYEVPAEHAGLSAAGSWVDLARERVAVGTASPELLAVLKSTDAGIKEYLARTGRTFLSFDGDTVT